MPRDRRAGRSPRTWGEAEHERSVGSVAPAPFPRRLLLVGVAALLVVAAAVTTVVLVTGSDHATRSRRALGVPADAVPPGGILEVRTGNDHFQLAADDLN